MAATIVHCGLDECRRVAVLASSGYVVHTCDVSLPRLLESLKQDDVAAVVVSEDGPEITDVPAVARSLTAAPIILFEGVDRKYKPSDFDAVIPCATSPSDWLKTIADVVERSRLNIERSKLVRENSSRLRQDSVALRSKSSAQCERAKREHERADELIERADELIGGGSANKRPKKRAKRH